MALSATEKKALEQLAKDLDTAASWTTGARSTQLNTLAGQARAIAAGDLDADAIKAREEAEAAQAAAAKEADAAAKKAAKANS